MKVRCRHGRPESAGRSAQVFRTCIAGSDAYLKPDAGRVMASLGDQVPMHAHDVRPDDLDVAHTVEWLERETLIDVRVAPHAWAGLRTVAPDGWPVVGFDPVRPGLFWLAGQGGHGRMMALSSARAARAMIVGAAWPDDLLDADVTEKALAPGREAIRERSGS